MQVAIYSLLGSGWGGGLFVFSILVIIESQAFNVVFESSNIVASSDGFSSVNIASTEGSSGLGSIRSSAVDKRRGSNGGVWGTDSGVSTNIWARSNIRSRISSGGISGSGDVRGGQVSGIGGLDIRSGQTSGWDV